MKRSLARVVLPTTEDYTPVHDHARLPWRFFARLIAADGRLSG
ncbi:hypothetical protein [Chthonobacter rhizosphaerae]|nr:hypothetical protein [Chthonobacter rhizosphaerae]